MILGQPIVDGFGNIFFGAGDGKIYALNAKGIVKWEYELRIPPSTSVMFLEKGVLCVGAATPRHSLWSSSIRRVRAGARLMDARIQSRVVELQ